MFVVKSSVFVIALVLIGAITSSAYGESTLENVFVGSQNCESCHEQETKAWQGSHHDKAMQHANDESVLGDFDNAELRYQNEVNRFFKKGNAYWVNIQDENGIFHDYKISFTFGFDPLQQYMVEFPDGRIQLIPFAWDSRSEAENGQKWFYLYPSMNPTSSFFWTNSGQNWNYTCADCHSTNLKKNYDAESDQYATTWSEIDVNCEACHGPASQHVLWANKKIELEDKHFGFQRDLSKSVKQWQFIEGQSTLQPTSIESTDLVSTCAQCHSRRVQLNDSVDHTQSEFGDKYELNLISPDIYYPDGQIFDEDYVYGSFLQSKMATKGVVCTDCHDPHTAQLVVSEEAVCLQCHLPNKYSSIEHSHHDPGSEGDRCVNCHMPETNYMQIDPRRDHAWHIPNPTRSNQMNTPDVCTDCHSDKNPQWAVSYINQWFPDSTRNKEKHFSLAYFAGEIGHSAAEQALGYIALDNNQTDIIRASALSRLSNIDGKFATIAAMRGSKDTSSLVRFAVVSATSSYNNEDRWTLLSPLLDDPILMVRTATAGALIQDWSSLNLAQQTRLSPALNEYMEIQRYNSDRAFARTNLGNVFRAQGAFESAVTNYQGAIEIEPYFETSYVNLADLYREQNRDDLAKVTLEKGTKNAPNSAAIQFSLGLLHLRQDNSTLALEHLIRSVELEPKNSYYQSVTELAKSQLNTPSPKSLPE
ncbi:tetratricopeptide repeat protein [Vibrio sp. DW001]|uniref:multiheme c-type cytochrome n=1 Tax=Vibrio sp. DW001 TaxID=2912315 RepID=UPI0023B18BE4|nr:multiheme c-type cytochrome [Vibrio sp. DW001]WED25605.1 tetratricopeptide repeat protein [Vibrio sp. DW001]